jgi:hypothetical protein
MKKILALVAVFCSPLAGVLASIAVPEAIAVLSALTVPAAAIGIAKALAVLGALAAANPVLAVVLVL